MHLRRTSWLAPLFVLLACTDDAASGSAPSDAGANHVVATPTLGPLLDAAPPAPPPPAGDGGCSAVVDMPTLLPAEHVSEGTQVAYSSNPPSSGPHYPIWANFQEYATPVPDGYLVHSLEHGAVLLLYKCSGEAECAPIVAALRAVRDSIVTDPGCDPSIRVRVIIAPRPANDVPVAAAAWGFTYRAQCVDGPSLQAFVRDHYAQGPENFCSAGLTTF